MRPLATALASLATSIGDGFLWMQLMISTFVLMALVDKGWCASGTIRVEHKEDVIFLCNTPDTDIVPHYVVWHKAHKLVTKLDGRHFINAATGSLTIHDVRIEDEGNYTCSAGWGKRFEPYTVMLFVSISPKIQVTSPNPVMPHVLEKITVSCETTGRPLPNIVWFSSQELPIDDTLTQPGSRFSIQEQLLSETVLESYLVIHPIFSEDRGSFTCKATNVVGSAHDGVIVDVQQKPNLLLPVQDNVIVYWWEGHKVNLTCQSVGNPAPVLVWKSFDDNGHAHRLPVSPMVDVRNGIIVTSNIWLPLEKTFTLPAEYKCSAENKYGVTPEKWFEVKEGFIPPTPEVYVLSIKDDEVVLSINIPFHVKDTPPVTYVSAHYRLEEAVREMESSTTFTGNGTRLVLRGVMLYYRYVIKVTAINMVGESGAHVLQLYSEEKSLTTMPSADHTDKAMTTDTDGRPSTSRNVNQTNGVVDDMDNIESNDRGRTLQSLEGNNSARLVVHRWIIAVVFLVCGLV